MTDDMLERIAGAIQEAHRLHGRSFRSMAEAAVAEITKQLQPQVNDVPDWDEDDFDPASMDDDQVQIGQRKYIAADLVQSQIDAAVNDALKRASVLKLVDEISQRDMRTNAAELVAGAILSSQEQDNG